MHRDGYIKNLDGIRAIAIVMVMSYHANLTHFGWMGVQLFFVLSGFLITGILWKEKFKTEPLSYRFKKFWVRRSLRIFPVYFGYLAFLGGTYLLFHFPSYYRTYIPYLATYTYNYTRTFPQWQGNPLFTHLWSLSIEEQFYLLFPLIVLLLPEKLIRNFMLLVIALAPLSRYLLGIYYKNRGLAPEVLADTIYWNTLSHLDAFFMGGIIPVLSLDKRIKKPEKILFISFLVALAAGTVNFFLDTPPGTNYINDLGYNHGLTRTYEYVWHYSLLNLFFASLILTLVSRHALQKLKGLRRLLENRWLVSIGKVSYGMYLFHWAILVYFYQRILPGHTIYTRALLFIPYVFLVYLFASLSFRFYESYFIRLKDKLFIRGKKTVIPPDPAPTNFVNLLNEIPDGSNKN